MSGHQIAISAPAIAEFQHRARPMSRFFRGNTDPLGPARAIVTGGIASAVIWAIALAVAI